MSRVGIFGWGVVAPRSPDIDAFATNLENADTWLEPFNGFGPDNFLVGRPQFDLSAYREWIDARFKPNKYRQIESKMGLPVQYALGCFIQALDQNPGIETTLRELGSRCRVYVGVGVGDLPVEHEQSIALYRAQRRWNRFWAQPERNDVLRRYLDDGVVPEDGDPIPPPWESVEGFEQDEAKDAWWQFWGHRSPQLREYLDEYRAIEAIAVEGEVESGKLKAIKEKRRRFRRLQEKWAAPQPPWLSVSTNLIWNIDNIPAAQISMMGRLTGMAIAPVAACATFGVALKLAMDAIRSGECEAVVVGASDPPPHPMTVAAFHGARVIASDAQVSKPLTQLRGTHVAGGAAVWILGDLEKMKARGYRPLGMEPVAVGATSDADHIITPSKEGPTEAMRTALAEAGYEGSDVGSWDVHATATPGDFNEVEMVREVMGSEVLVTARKGTFGHGMAACGGWELTAQYLGYERGALYPTPAGEGRAQRRNRPHPRRRRLRHQLPGTAGAGRQDVYGDRRHQRLRRLAALGRGRRGDLERKCLTLTSRQALASFRGRRHGGGDPETDGDDDDAMDGRRAGGADGIDRPYPPPLGPKGASVSFRTQRGGLPALHGAGSRAADPDRAAQRPGPVARRGAASARRGSRPAG